jgi:tetratricopeptide (TPR) repeat protein
VKRKNRQPQRPSATARVTKSAVSPAVDRPKRDLLPGLLLLVLTVIVFLPALTAQFIWDDYAAIVNNPLITEPGGLHLFWWSTIPPDYFPMTSSLFWIEWRIWGAHPFGYHFVNLLLHAIGVLLVWRVLLRLKLPGAWLGAAIFAIHPVNAETVVWISEAKNTLALVFYALTLLWYLRFEDANGYSGRDAPGRNSRGDARATKNSKAWFIAALAAFVLALLSKTAPAPLPFVLLGIAWWRHGRITRRDVVRTIPFFAAALALGLVTIWFQYHRAIGNEVIQQRPLLARVAGAGWAAWFYLFKAVLPVNLMAVYPLWPINPANPLVFLPGLLLVAVIVVLWLRRGSWGRPGLLALGYFVLLLLPVLGFFHMSFARHSLVADRWQYFALIGPAALIAAGLAALARRHAALRFPLPALLLLVFGGLAWRHSGTYHDDETLWRTTIEHNPQATMAQSNYGEILLKRGDIDGAIDHFQKGVDAQPDYAEVLHNLGLALVQKGEHDAAIPYFRRALDIQPDSMLALKGLRIELLARGEIGEVIERCRKALQFRPNDPDILYNYGIALAAQGNLADAAATLRIVLAAQPGNVGAHVGLGEILAHQGATAEAAVHFQKALELDPSNAEARTGLAQIPLGQGTAAAENPAAPRSAEAENNTATALLQQGSLDDALAHFRRALELKPEFPDALNNYGSALRRKGLLDEGLAQFRKAIELQPGHFEARNNLASALLQQGRISEAVAQYEACLKLQPDNVEINRRLGWIFATSPEAALRNGPRAVELARHARQLAPDNPVVLAALAAAYAENKQFPEAISTVQETVRMPAVQQNSALTSALQNHLKLYQSGSPLRDDTLREKK